MSLSISRNDVVKMMVVILCCYLAAFEGHRRWLGFFMSRLRVRRWDDAAIAEKRWYLIWSVVSSVTAFNLGWVANKFVLKLLWAVLRGNTTSETVNPTAPLLNLKEIFFPTTRRGLLCFGVFSLLGLSALNTTFSYMGTQKTAMTRDQKHFIVLAAITGVFYLVALVLVALLVLLLLLKWCWLRKVATTGGGGMSHGGNSPNRHSNPTNIIGEVCSKLWCGCSSCPTWTSSKLGRVVFVLMFLAVGNMFLGLSSANADNVSALLSATTGGGGPGDGVLPNSALPSSLSTFWNSLLMGRPDPRPYHGVIETWDLCRALNIADGRTDPSFMPLWMDVLPRRWINFFTGSEVCPLLAKDSPGRFSHFDDYSQLLLVPAFCGGAEESTIASATTGGANNLPKVIIENPAVNALTDMEAAAASNALTLENRFVNEAWQRARDAYKTHPLQEYLLLQEEKREVEEPSVIPAPAIGGLKGVDQSTSPPLATGVGQVALNVGRFAPLTVSEVEKALLASSGDVEGGDLPASLSKWWQPQSYPTRASKVEVTQALAAFLNSYSTKYGASAKLRAVPLLSGFVSVECGSLSEYHSHPWQLGRNLESSSGSDVSAAQQQTAVPKRRVESTVNIISSVGTEAKPTPPQQEAEGEPQDPLKDEETTLPVRRRKKKKVQEEEGAPEVKDGENHENETPKPTTTTTRIKSDASTPNRRGMEEQQQETQHQEDMKKKKKRYPPGRNKSVIPTLFIMIDALSKQAMRREYPATTQWLENRASRARHTSASMPVPTKPEYPETWVEYSGMTVMGHSTPQNMKPMLNGLTHNSPVDLVDHKKYNIFKMIKGHDQETFNGMYTASCSHTQHYTFFLSQKDLWSAPYFSQSAGFGGKNGDVDDDNWSQMCHFDYGPFEDTFFGPYSIQRRCIGKDYVHQLVLNHTLTSIRRHLAANRNFFHLLLHFEAHEGSHSVTTLMDADLVGFLESLDRLGFFEKAALVIGGDHGSHTGPLFEWTLLGRYERTTPLFLLSLPPTAFSENGEGGFPAIDFEDLKKNTKVLSTHIDTFATLADLLGGNHGTGKPTYQFTIGKSLLRPLNLERRRKGCVAANANLLCVATWCGKVEKVTEAQWVWPFENTTYTEKVEDKKKKGVKLPPIPPATATGK